MKNKIRKFGLSLSFDFESVFMQFLLMIYAPPVIIATVIINKKYALNENDIAILRYMYLFLFNAKKEIIVSVLLVIDNIGETSIAVFPIFQKKDL